MKDSSFFDEVFAKLEKTQNSTSQNHEQIQKNTKRGSNRSTSATNVGMLEYILTGRLLIIHFVDSVEDSCVEVFEIIPEFRVLRLTLHRK